MAGPDPPLGMVLGVPDRPELPLDFREPESDRRPPPVDRPAAVLFDFHGTLAQVEDPVTWVREAARSCGAELDPIRATSLADRFLTAGRPGGPLPDRLPPHLAELYSDRDLSGDAHRAAYLGLLEQVDAGIDGLVPALYERLLTPDGWIAYADTVPTLKALRAAGVPVALISNIGFDVRAICAELGFGDLVDAYVLSYEVGRIKPDPAIFLRACGMLGVEPERTLMVGDTPADAAAVAVGCRALIVPAGPPGVYNGIAAVLDLISPPPPLP